MKLKIFAIYASTIISEKNVYYVLSTGDNVLMVGNSVFFHDGLQIYNAMNNDPEIKESLIPVGQLKSLLTEHIGTFNNKEELRLLFAEDFI